MIYIYYIKNNGINRILQLGLFFCVIMKKANNIIIISSTFLFMIILLYLINVYICIKFKSVLY